MLIYWGVAVDSLKMTELNRMENVTNNNYK